MFDQQIDMSFKFSSRLNVMVYLSRVIITSFIKFISTRVRWLSWFIKENGGNCSWYRFVFWVCCYYSLN